MISNDLLCPKCAGPLRLSERASRKAGKLIYDCRECAKRYSLGPSLPGLVEEGALEDSGAATQRIRVMRKPKARGRLTEMHAPSSKGVLPRGLTVTFEVADGPERGHSLRVEHSRCIIGREEGQLRVADPLISRRHAVLEVFDPDTIILKDLSSTNGTFHNGRLIDHCKLQDGDEIRLGSTILNVLIEKTAVAGARPPR